MVGSCGTSSAFRDVQLGEAADDLEGFEADGDDAEEEFEEVAGVGHGFGGPEVGVVDDAAVFVGGDGLAFHDPFEDGLAVDDVVVGFEGGCCGWQCGHCRGRWSCRCWACWSRGSGF